MCVLCGYCVDLFKCAFFLVMESFSLDSNLFILTEYVRWLLFLT